MSRQSRGGLNLREDMADGWHVADPGRGHGMRGQRAEQRKKNMGSWARPCTVHVEPSPTVSPFCFYSFSFRFYSFSSVFYFFVNTK